MKFILLTASMLLVAAVFTYVLYKLGLLPD